MAVYVDSLLWRGWKLYGRPVQSCHMVADTVDELLAFAERLRLKPEWLQGEGIGCIPHFDLVASKRIRAVRAGAKEFTSWRECAEVFARIRRRSEG